MDCDECHGEPHGAAFRGLSHDSCTDCHDEPEAEKFSMETCGYCHEKRQLAKLQDWQAEPARPERGIFVHTEALADRCSECHAGILEEGLETVPRLDRREILKIRDEAHRSGGDCTVCHLNMDRYTAPPDHDIYWTKRHGLFGQLDDAACSVCHSEDSCRECHSVMMPASHNNMWRLRTHGIESAWDRQRCMICHEEDSCTSCHSQVKPRSHGPLWDDRHCTLCHVTEGESCVVCHVAGNNKAELHQDFWPPSHDSFNNQTDCLLCHPF
jgi:hypothetical protein